MALSGYHTGSATNGLSVRVRWSARQNADDKLRNRSYVTANAYLVIQSTFSVDANAKKYGSITVNGHTSNFEKVLGKLSGGEHWVGSYSRYVDHDNNGTKSFSVSAQFAPNVTIRNHGWVGNLSTGSKPYTLDTIPRASSISRYTGDAGNNDFYVDGNINYTIKTASSSFNHVIRLYRNNGTLTTRNIPAGTTSGIITLTEAERNLFYGWGSTWKKAEIVMEVTTYSGDTKIGDTTKFSPNRNAVIRESVAKPLLGNVTYADTDAKTIALTNEPGILIQSKSKPRFSIAGASSRLSSTIRNVSITLNNATKSVAFNTTSTGIINIDFDTINFGTTNYASVTVTDSRGYTERKSVAVIAIPYSKPKFILYGATRRNGFDNQSYLSYKIGYPDIMDDRITIEYWIKSADTSIWGSPTDLTPYTVFKREHGEFVAELINRTLGEPTNTKSHTIRIRITDHYGTYDQQLILDAASGLAIIDRDGWAFQEPAKGVSGEGVVGHLAIAPEVGSNYEGHWVKHADGRLEQYGYFEENITTVANSSGYMERDEKLKNFPMAFVGDVALTVDSAYGYGIYCSVTTIRLDNYKYIVSSIGPRTNYAWKASWQAKGRWK